MQYSKKDINGDAGEHLVASRIIYYYGFPCRLQNIDIGIDAEIEITDNNLRSTGNILKAQIKSTESDKMAVYIKGKHIKYWNDLNIPVIVLLVHLKTDKIFWHCVDNISQYSLHESGYKIEFDPINELNMSSKERFVEISLFPLKQQIIFIYTKAFKLAQEDMPLIDSRDYDIITYEFFAENFFGIKYNLEKVDLIFRRYEVLKSLEQTFREKLNFIRNYLREVEEGIETIEEDSPDYFDHLRNSTYDWSQSNL